MTLYKLLVAVLFIISNVSSDFVKRPRQNGDLEVQYEGQFPFVVSVQYNEQHYCGGSIIDLGYSDSWGILTAASCLEKVAKRQGLILRTLHTGVSSAYQVKTT